jgi:anthranilate phosphoribosyltransferase
VTVPAGAVPQLTAALERLATGEDLTADETAAAISVIMAGEASEALIAAFLTALRVKGETAEELAGAVEAVRARMTPFLAVDGPRPLLDTCGTGGDGANTVNVSTATALVVAACGVPVAKHGNRSASGNSGSAEVLTELGVRVDAPVETLRLALDELGITFLFAPAFHPAMRFAAAVRRQLPFRTLFNLVGPLANPARPAFQLVGVAGERQAGLVAQALVRLGIRRAAVVTGGDGLDEVTLDGPTSVHWIDAGAVTRRTWTAQDFGLPRVAATALRVDGPSASAARIRELLAGQEGPVRSLVLANSAAALLVAGRAPGLSAGVEQAARAVDSGAAAGLLERWQYLSSGAAGEGREAASPYDLGNRPGQSSS